MSTIAPSSPAPASSIRLIATLMGIAVFSGVALALTYEFTKPIILANENAALEEAVSDVLPGAVSRKNYRLEDGMLTPLPDERAAEANVFAGLDADGKRVGFALPGEARGYADVIRLLYGYDPEAEEIVGMTVLASNETPGLGDRILWDEQFLLNFTHLDAALDESGKVLRNEIETVKHGEKEQDWEIDGISGATVSSMAVGQALRVSTNEWLPRLNKALNAEESE